jgi:hypothetical protein
MLLLAIAPVQSKHKDPRWPGAAEWGAPGAKGRGSARCAGGGRRRVYAGSDGLAVVVAPSSRRCGGPAAKCERLRAERPARDRRAQIRFSRSPLCAPRSPQGDGVYAGRNFTTLRWCNVRSAQRPDNYPRVVQGARGRLVTLTAACDARMDRPRAFLSVGGFVSSAAGWTGFEGEWRERLAQEGLSYFHMGEFADSVGHFEPLKKQQQRRRELLKDLLGIIVSHAYRKFGVTVEVETADAEFAEQNKLEYAPNALALAGDVACGQAVLWAREEGSTLQFVFEDGDLGRGRFAEQVKILTGAIPTFRPKKDSPEIKAFAPLQAADILVYQMSLVGRQGTPRVTFNYPFDELNRMPGAILQPRRRHRPRPST